MLMNVFCLRRGGHTRAAEQISMNIERQSPLNDFDAVAQHISEPSRPPLLAEGLGCNGLVKSCYILFHGDAYFGTCWVHHLRESNSFFVVPPTQQWGVGRGDGQSLSNARTRSRKCALKKRHELNSQGSIVKGC